MMAPELTTPQCSSPGRTPPTKEVCDAVIAEVAFRMVVPEAELRGRLRIPYIALARHTAFLALNYAGLNPAEISRFFDRNHSTVVHGIAVAERVCYAEEIARTAANLAGDLQSAFRSWLAHCLRGVPPADAAAVHAYATCSLLGWQRLPGTTCAYGLLLVAGSFRVRAALERTLTMCDLAPMISRVDQHIRQLGYRRGA